MQNRAFWYILSSENGQQASSGPATVKAVGCV